MGGLSPGIAGFLDRPIRIAAVASGLFEHGKDQGLCSLTTHVCALKLLGGSGGIVYLCSAPISIPLLGLPQSSHVHKFLCE